MLRLISARLSEVLKAVAPLVGAVLVLQLALIGASPGPFLEFMAGSALVVVGMLLLFIGIDVGILPMGRYIGAELPKKGSLWLILGVAFALGFATTVAEPDVLVLAAQVERLSEGAVRGLGLAYAMAVGVGLFAALGLLRVVRGGSMRWLVALLCTAAVALSLIAPAQLVPLAFDAGSVTTGVLTTPVVLALALGLSSVLAARSAVADGFGLLGLASLGPIVMILLLALLLP